MAQWTLDDIPPVGRVRPKQRSNPSWFRWQKPPAWSSITATITPATSARFSTTTPSSKRPPKTGPLEEVRRPEGAALRRWAELANPAFNCDDSFKAFTTGYQLPANVSGSVRLVRAAAS